MYSVYIDVHNTPLPPNHTDTSLAINVCLQSAVCYCYCYTEHMLHKGSVNSRTAG